MLFPLKYSWYVCARYINILIMTLTLHVDCASSINTSLPPAVKHRSLYIPLVNTWFIVTFSSPASVIPASSGWSAWYSCNRYFLILNRLQKILSFTLPLTFSCIMLFPLCFVISCSYYIKKTALYSRITQYYFIIKNYAYILHFLRKYSFLSSSSACFSCGSFLIISLYPIFSISGVSILFQKIYIQPVLP